MVHRVPRFAACAAEEFGPDWQGFTPLTRITTAVYREGDLDYFVEDVGKGDGLVGWLLPRPWCGQTVLTFALPLP